MAKLSLAILLAIALTTANAYTACKEGLDICGWALQNAGKHHVSLTPSLISLK